MVARDFFEVLISYELFSMMVLKVAQKSIGERVNSLPGQVRLLMCKGNATNSVKTNWRGNADENTLEDWRECCTF